VVQKRQLHRKDHKKKNIGGGGGARMAGNGGKRLEQKGGTGKCSKEVEIRLEKSTTEELDFCGCRHRFSKIRNMTRGHGNCRSRRKEAVIWAESKKRQQEACKQSGQGSLPKHSGVGTR